MLYRQAQLIGRVAELRAAAEALQPAIPNGETTYVAIQASSMRYGICARRGDAAALMSTSAAPLEQGFHMLLGVVVGSFQVMQLLLQIGDLGLYIDSFLGLTRLDILGGGKDEPIVMLTEAAGSKYMGDVPHLAHSIIYGRILRQGVELTRGELQHAILTVFRRDL